jgi:hypothetical protein
LLSKIAATAPEQLFKCSLPHYLILYSNSGPTTPEVAYSLRTEVDYALEGAHSHIGDAQWSDFDDALPYMTLSQS